jgi:hypothetical protein
MKGNLPQNRKVRCMGDEYSLFGVFFAGIVAQGAVLTRSARGATGALAIALVSSGASWFFTRGEEDRLFSFLLMSSFLFVVAFAWLYKDWILLRLSATSLLHYTFLGIFALYAYWRGGPMPIWLLGWFALPLLSAVYLLEMPSPGKVSKLVAYAWFLLFLTFVLVRQLSTERVRELYQQQGFSLALYAYVFFTGMVFLQLASNLLYLVFTIPGGDPDDHITRKVVVGRPSPLEVLLLVLHGLALWSIWRFQLLSPGLALNASVIALAFISLVSSETERRSEEESWSAT